MWISFCGCGVMEHLHGFGACPNMVSCNFSTPRESDLVISHLKALGTHTPIVVLLSMRACVMTVKLCMCIF